MRIARLTAHDHSQLTQTCISGAQWRGTHFHIFLLNIFLNRGLKLHLVEGGLLEASETRLNEIAMKGQEMERESELVSGDGGFQIRAWKVKRFQGFESLVFVFTRHKILEISRNVIIKYFFKKIKESPKPLCYCLGPFYQAIHLIRTRRNWWITASRSSNPFPSTCP